MHLVTPEQEDGDEGSGRGNVRMYDIHVFTPCAGEDAAPVVGYRSDGVMQMFHPGPVSYFSSWFCSHR